MKNPRRFFLTIVAPLMVLTLFLSACSKTREEGMRYHCPMHPTYISDRMGDCPICGMRLVPIENPPTSPSSAENPNPAVEYFCPMCPEVLADTPGQCPVCGMNLKSRPKPAEPLQKPDHTEHAAIERPPAEIAAAGIQTVPAVEGFLTREVRAVGTVVVDESRVRHMHTKISGWVERLFVNVTGQAVTPGQPLLEIYSPELLASQEEYLRAVALARQLAASPLPEAQGEGKDLVAAARRRLELFDVPEELLAALDRGEKPQRVVTLKAPAGGFVSGKDVFEGHRVEPGMTLMQVTDLGEVWLDARFYEIDAAQLKLGQKATVHVAGDGALQRTGRVIFIDPFLDPVTRTLKARLALPNPGLALRPGMFADVTLQLERTQGVLIPDSAVLETGRRSLVFVKTVPGRFVPREVVVKAREAGQAVLSSGVSAGEQVAVGANFLLDSESRLAATMQTTPPPPPSHSPEPHRP